MKWRLQIIESADCRYASAGP